MTAATHDVDIVLVGKTSAARADMVAIVTLPGELETRVRFRWPAGPNTRHAWRCDECGRTPIPACRHARAVVDHVNTRRSTPC